MVINWLMRRRDARNRQKVAEAIWLLYPDTPTYWGYLLSLVTGLSAASVQVALTSLESDGWLRAFWENSDHARAEDRHPRRMYELTEHGKAMMEWWYGA